MHSNECTKLRNRALWFNGDMVINEGDVSKFLDQGVDSGRLFVEHISKEIARFNTFVPPEKQIRLIRSSKSGSLDLGWKIPDEYKNIDLYEHIVDLCYEECVKQDWSYENDSEKIITRGTRIQEEFNLFKKLDLLPVLRALLYIINTLRTLSVTWGVGRGSSVSSYILYLIGVHDVDSVKYDIDIRDFLRTDE